MTYLQVTDTDQSNLNNLPSDLTQWDDEDLMHSYQASRNSFDTCSDESDYGYWTRAHTILEEELIKRGLTY